MSQAYPLQWPDGWPRNKNPWESRFKGRSFAQARDGLIRQIKLMGGRNIVISSNIELRLDGIPYANRREPVDVGVAVYWFDPESKARRAMACDRWHRTRCNMRALERSVDALRGIARWGSTEIVNRAFEGFKALPAAGDDWRSVLGINGPGQTDLEYVKGTYRALARDAHPDHDGNPHEMQRLNEAMAAAERELGGQP